MKWKQGISRRRIAGILVVGSLLILGAVGYIEFFLRRPIGTGPAGPSVPADEFSELWSTRDVVLVGVGDSITAGLGAKTPAHRYFQSIVRNPPDDFDDLQGVCLSTVLPNLQSVNLAVSGTTSLDHERVVKEELNTYPADVFGLIVITTGGNDLIHNYGRTPPREGAMYGATRQQADPWIAQFETRLHTMVEGITERFPGGCEIFLADIYDPTDGVGDAPSVFLPAWPDGLTIHAAYNDIIHRCAQQYENVHLVPLYETFLGHGSHCRQFWRDTYRPKDPNYWYFDNVEDPNPRGYDAIRRVFLVAMAQARHRIGR